MTKSLLWLGALVLCVGNLAAAADLRLIEAAKKPGPRGCPCAHQTEG